MHIVFFSELVKNENKIRADEVYVVECWWVDG